VMSGLFMALVTPFLSGGIPVHIFLLTRKGYTIGLATATVLGGSIISQSAQIVLSVVALGATGIGMDNPSFSRALATLSWLIIPSYIAIITLAATACLKANAAGAWLKRRALGRPAAGRSALKMAQALQDFGSGIRLLLKGHKTYLLLAVSFTFSYLIFQFSSAAAVFLALGSPQPLRSVMAVQTIVFLLSMALPTPGGSGTLEIGAYSVYSHLVPTDTLKVFILLFRTLTYYVPLALGGIVFFLLLRRVHRRVA